MNPSSEWESGNHRKLPRCVPWNHGQYHSFDCYFQRTCCLSCRIHSEVNNDRFCYETLRRYIDNPYELQVPSPTRQGFLNPRTCPPNQCIHLRGSKSTRNHCLSYSTIPEESDRTPRCTPARLQRMMWEYRI